MPRGVKGSGKPKKPAPARPSIDQELDAIDSRTPTCARDGAPLAAGGECLSCKARAARFADLLKYEMESRRCGICKAPAKTARGGRRLCVPCRKLAAREEKAKQALKQSATGQRS